MRPARVTHAALALSAGFVLAAALFAWHASTPPGTGPALLFESRCGGCHEAAMLARSYRGRHDLDRAEARLRAFLDTHGHCTPEESRVLAAYLAHGGPEGGR